MKISWHYRDGENYYRAIGIAYGSRPIFVFIPKSLVVHTITVMLLFWHCNITWGKNLPL